jgi:multiple sugar transport system permease protein
VTRSHSAEWRSAWVALAPALVLGGFFIFLPLLASFYLGLWQWPLIGAGQRFLGLGNYVRLLGDRDFWRALGITALYVAASVPAGAAVSLALAVGLREDLAGRRWLRAVLYLPAVIPSIASALFWKAALQPQVGIVNVVLRALRLPAPPWLAHPGWALFALVLIAIWHNAGYHMVIFITGLGQIPNSLYEAARVDGAGAWVRFRHITWPLLRPTTALVLITGSIFALQVFGPVYVLTGGGPARGTVTLVYYLYERAFGFRELGYGSAIAWSLVLLTFPLAALSFWLQGRQEAGR